MGGRQLDERKLAVLDGQESAVLRENNNLFLYCKQARYRFFYRNLWDRKKVN
jgi:hypothetical protein